VRKTIRAYSDFAEYADVVGGNLLSPAAWDALRGSGARYFSLYERRQDWLASFADNKELKERAQVIVSLCREQGLSRIFSVGAGIGGLEYLIKTENPDLHLTCTDFAPKATDRLREVFEECDEVEVFDVMQDEWRATPETLYMFHRVDTELSDRDWRRCFARMAASGVSPVLVVATELLTPEKKKRMRHLYLSHRLHRKPLTFTGYVRNREAFRMLWSSGYDTAREMGVGDLEGFLVMLR
jgi:hypothetical protein